MVSIESLKTDAFEYPALNITYLIDTSESMQGERIKQLNRGMSEAVSAAGLLAAAKGFTPSMRVIEFNTTARWLYGTKEHGVSDIDWVELTAGGTKNTFEAIETAREIMSTKYLGRYSYCPVVILITDGVSCDRERTLQSIVKLKYSLESKSYPKKDKIIRVAIGIQDHDPGELEAFASVVTTNDKFGKIQEKQKLVFHVEDIQTLSSAIREITESVINYFDRCRPKCHDPLIDIDYKSLNIKEQE